MTLTIAKKAEAPLQGTPLHVVPEPEQPAPVVYFAVQVLKSENFRDVALAVLTAAEKKKVLFRTLEPLGVTTVGTTPFIRFRGDVPDAFKICKSLGGRSFIAESGGIYTVYFVDGRTGRIPTSSICIGPSVGFGTAFAGTKVVRWKRQFVQDLR